MGEAEDFILKNIMDLWLREAKDRRLDGSNLMPIRLVRCDTGEAVLAPESLEESIWTSAEYREAASGVVLRRGMRRAVVYGSSGSGKTTFALMLTHGLAEHRRAMVGKSRRAMEEENQPTEDGFLPLLLSLSSWDAREDFAAWFGRVAVASYPDLRRIRIGEGTTLLGRLMTDTKILLVLDSFDELLDDEDEARKAREALNRIDEKVLKEQPIILLCRDSIREIVDDGLADSYVLSISEASADDVRSYLDALARREKATQHWQPVLDELKYHPDGELARVLRTPLYASLACAGFEADEALPQQLAEITSAAEAESKAKEFLLNDYVARAMDRAKNWCRKSSMRWFESIMHKMQAYSTRSLTRWLEFIAHKMQAYPTQSLSWWRMCEVVPHWVFAIAVGVAVGPPYWLALMLPEGLTRGFAIGCTTCFALGLLRGIKLRPSAAVVTGVTTFAMVATIGGAQLGWPEVLPDIVEIGIAMSVVMLCKTWLTVARNDRRSSWVKVCIASVAAGAAAGVAVAVVHAVLPDVPLFTGPLSVGRSVTLGVGVATMVCRLLSTVDAPPRPSMIEFNIDRRAGQLRRHLSGAIISGFAMGVAGGFVGGMNHGLDYGWRIALIFGLVAGLPVGVGGGLLGWLSHLDPKHGRPATVPQKTMRNDRVAAIASIIVLGMISAAAIGLLLGLLRPVVADLQGSSFRVSPVDGALFGLALGMPFAALMTAWPAFLVSHTWFALTARLPWRFWTFLSALHISGLLRQEGATYQFRFSELQTLLAARYKAVSRRPGEGPPPTVACPENAVSRNRALRK
ncbi:MAG: NACHT domain-containing protein [Actinomycetota bacterium]|nr:NACHT domain-containing protein [Actinomycetota bacterium]